MLDELPPPFAPYTVTVAGAPFLVLEPQQADAHRVQTAAGAVLGLACADSSAELTAETLAVLLATPQTVTVGVPASVTRRQLFLWLNTQGITRAALRTQLAGNEAALIELEEATEFRRAHPLVAQLGQTLGLGATQIDDAFRAAALL
jgi:hypothetical protein